MKLLVLGFDGLDYDLLKAYNSSFLNSLQGCLLQMTPEDPLMKSGPSWTTLWTGLSKETHGILKTVGDPDVWREFDRPCVWNVLNDNALTVGAFNLPCTFPPKAIWKFFVCGFPTPPNSIYCFPRSLIQLLDLRGHIVDFLQVTIGETRDSGFVDDDVQYKKFINELYDKLESHPNYLYDLNDKIYLKQRDLIKELYTDKEVDVAIIQFSLVDHLGHFISHLPGDPMKDYIYPKVEEIIKDMYSFFKPDNFIIVSDHGFKPMRQSGSPGHTAQAVAFFQGNNINVDYNKIISNLDFMSTLLFMLDIPHPPTEGQVRYGLFKSQHLSELDEAAIRQKMKMLGYL